MDAGGIKKKVEQHSATTTEWSVKETDEAGEAPELILSSMYTTTEAFEPGGGVTDVTTTLGSEAQDEFPLVAKPSYPQHIEHSGTGGT